MTAIPSLTVPVQPSARPAIKAVAPSPPATAGDQVELSRTVLANRISAVLNVGAIAACGLIGAGAAALTAGALPALAVAGLVGLGALAGSVGALFLSDRNANDAFRGLRTVAKRIADHLPGLAARIKPSEAERRIASAPRLTEDERRAFIDRLQPGDVVLDCTSNGVSFMVIVKTCGGKCDYTHAMMYDGDGKVLHSTDGGSQRGDLFTVLGKASHALAIRPDWKPGEAGRALQHGVDILGRPYDWFASMNEKRLGCAEMVYHMLMAGAPESDMKLQTTLGHVYPAPRDFLTLKGATVVAEAGQDRSFWNDIRSAFRVND